MFYRLCVQNPASGLLQIGHDLENDNDAIISRHGVIVKFSLLVQVSCQYHYLFWSYVNFQGLTRNPEIGNIHVWVLPNIWRLERVGHTKFGTNVSNEVLLNAANARITACTVSELLRESSLVKKVLFSELGIFWHPNKQRFYRCIYIIKR